MLKKGTHHLKRHFSLEISRKIVTLLKICLKQVEKCLKQEVATPSDSLTHRDISWLSKQLDDLDKVMSKNTWIVPTVVPNFLFSFG